MITQFRHSGHHPGMYAEEELLVALGPDSTVGDAIALIAAKSTPLA